MLGPVEKVEVVVVLERRRVEYFERRFWDLSMLSDREHDVLIVKI